MNVTPVSHWNTDSVIRRIRQILLSKTSWNTGWVLAGSLSVRGFGILTFVILSRTLGPSDFGTLTIVLAVLTMVLELSDLGINSSAIRYGAEIGATGDQAQLTRLYSVILRSRLTMGIVAFITGVILARPISIYVLHQPYLESYLYIVFFGIIGSIINSAFGAILQSRQEFRKSVMINISYSTVALVGIALLALTHQLTTLYALGAYIVASLVATVVGFSLVPRALLSLRYWDKEIARKLFAFGKWLALWAIANSIAERISIFMLTSMTTPAEVGYFNAAFRVASLVQLLPSAYSAVLLPKASAYAHSMRLWHEFRKAMLFSAIISGAILLSSFFLDSAFLLLAGNAYASAVPTLRVLLWMMAIYSIISPFNMVLYAKERSYYFGIAAIGKLIFTYWLNLWLLPQYGSLGAALSATIICIGTLIFYAIGVLYVYIKDIKARDKVTAGNAGILPALPSTHKDA